MLQRIIEYSVRNRFLVILVTLLLIVGGTVALVEIPLDAIPDLSDVQVIVLTEYPGQAPQVVEDQVTYPLTTAMLAVPHAQTVRGFSFFGLSFVYIIFEDGTDLYWARSRVLEYLSYVTDRLPQGVNPALGPDATGVGWVYEYVLRSDRHNLAELRSIQDWVPKVRTDVGPRRVRGRQHRRVRQAVPGGSRPQQAADLRHTAQPDQDGDPAEQQRRGRPGRRNGRDRIHGPGAGIHPVRRGPGERHPRRGRSRHARPPPPGRPGDGTGPELRRGLAEWNGEGEIVGGIIVMRYGENAMDVIRDVEARLESLKSGLPEGVEIITAYDRSNPDRARHRQPFRQAAGGKPHRRPDLHHIPDPLPLGPGGHPHPADKRARRLPRHVLAGDQRQHHVPGRHRHRHRHAGGRRHRHDREHPQAHGTGPREEGPLADRARRHEGSGAVAVLLPADHHPVLRAHLRPAGPGGPALQAAGLHEDVHDGRGGPAGDHLRARPDGVPGPGPHPAGAQEPAQPPAGVPLPARDPGGDPGEMADHRRRRGRPVGHVVSAAAHRVRVHAAALRGRPALHAHHGPRHIDHQGPPAPAADRPDHRLLPRSGTGLRQGRTGRYGDRSGAAVHDRDHHHAQARGAVASRHDAGRTRASPQRRHTVSGSDQRVDHAHPHPDRHAFHGDPHPDRRQADGRRPGRAVGPGRAGRGGARRAAGHAQRLSREDHGRQLPRLRDRPGRSGPVRDDGGRRAGRHHVGGGRRGRDLHGRGDWSATR